MAPIRFSTLILLCTALNVQAQPAKDTPAVDQAVGDLDPQSVSLRRVEWGKAQLGGQDSNLVEVDNPRAEPWADRPWLDLSPLAPQYRKLYYRIARGYRARLMRPDYLIAVSDDRDDPQYLRNIPPIFDRQFIELVPADTVYEISVDPMFAPGSRLPAKPVRPRPPEQLPSDSIGAQRVEGKIDGKVDGRINGAVP